MFHLVIDEVMIGFICNSTCPENHHSGDKALGSWSTKVRQKEIIVREISIIQNDRLCRKIPSCAFQ
jgi:hypothetical protein